MSPEIERLEALLARVQRNAALLLEERAHGRALPYTNGEPVAALAPMLEGYDAATSDDGVELEDADEPMVESAVTSNFETESAAPRLEIIDLDESAETEPPSSADRVSELRESSEAVAHVEETADAWAEAAAAAAAYAPSSELEFEPSDDVAAAPRTPPPESGQQASPPQRTQLPELDAESPVSLPGRGPSLEQLGSTVELEPATAAPLDIEPIELPAARSSLTDDFEERLPAAVGSAVYDESLAPPATAQAELEAIDRAEQERAARRSAFPHAAAPQAVSQPAAQQPALPSSVQHSNVQPSGALQPIVPYTAAVSLPPDTIAAPPQAFGDRPEGVVLRSPVPANVTAATFEGQRPQEAARTFLQLLDDSLSLGSQR